MKKVVLTSLSLIFMTGTAIACDMHGMGFGVFGGFAKNAVHEGPKKEAVLKLKHKDRMTIETGKEFKVDINYELPLAYRNIVIEFSSSDKVSILSDTSLVPMRIKGRYPLYFVANSAGKHTIDVNVNAIKNGQPYSLEKRIQIDSF